MESMRRAELACDILKAGTCNPKKQHSHSHAIREARADPRLRSQPWRRRPRQQGGPGRPFPRRHVRRHHLPLVTHRQPVGHQPVSALRPRPQCRLEHPRREKRTLRGPGRHTRQHHLLHISSEVTEVGDGALGLLAGPGVRRAALREKLTRKDCA